MAAAYTKSKMDKKKIQDYQALIAKREKRRAAKGLTGPLPIAICDTTIFLSKLPLLRRWVSDGVCKIVLVPQVIDELDELKVGWSNAAYQSRKAIKYLEEFVAKREVNILTPGLEAQVKWAEIKQGISAEAWEKAALPPHIPIGIRGCLGHLLYRQLEETHEGDDTLLADTFILVGSDLALANPDAPIPAWKALASILDDVKVRTAEELVEMLDK